MRSQLSQVERYELSATLACSHPTEDHQGCETSASEDDHFPFPGSFVHELKVYSPLDHLALRDPLPDIRQQKRLECPSVPGGCTAERASEAAGGEAHGTCRLERGPREDALGESGEVGAGEGERTRDGGTREG